MDPFPRTRGLIFLPVLTCFLAMGARAEKPADSTLTVAAAANLSEVFKEVAAAFTKETGVRVNLSFGATQQLTQQIENGAPFDVFAAADTEHIDKLDGEGLLAPSTNAVYARGFLVLWCPSATAVKRVEDLKSSEVRFLAVAKPETAPYGKAAVELLKSTGVWVAVEKKIVYAENINLTRQYVASGNADCGFVAKSLVRNETAGIVEIDPAKYQPIRQSIAAIKSSTHAADSQRFVNFVLGPKAQQILAAWGYGAGK